MQRTGVEFPLLGPLEGKINGPRDVALVPKNSGEEGKKVRGQKTLIRAQSDIGPCCQTAWADICPPEANVQSGYGLSEFLSAWGTFDQTNEGQSTINYSH